MMKIRRITASLTTAVLLAGLAISFNACTEQSPLASSDSEVQDSISLSKGNPRSYPQSGSVETTKAAILICPVVPVFPSRTVR